MRREMFQTFFGQSFLKFMTAVIMTTALLAVPAAAYSHRDCPPLNSLGVDKHGMHDSATAAAGCCAASHCYPVLPRPVALAEPATSRSVPSGAVQLGQPLLLVRSLHPPPRGVVVLEVPTNKTTGDML